MLLRDALALAPSTRWLAALLGSAEWLEGQRIAWGWMTSAGSVAAPQPVDGTATVPTRASEVTPSRPEEA
jgi:hypothetical protein